VVFPGQLDRLGVAVPEQQLIIARGGKDYDFGAFSVKVIPSRVPAQMLGNIPAFEVDTILII